MKDWREKKAQQKRYWMRICNVLHKQYLDLKEKNEYAAWMDNQKKKHPSLFK